MKWKSFGRIWLWDPTDCSPPGSSVHGISQARILECVATSFSRESSQPSNEAQVSHIVGQLFIICFTRKAQRMWMLYKWTGYERRGGGWVTIAPITHGFQRKECLEHITHVPDKSYEHYKASMGCRRTLQDSLVAMEMRRPQ